MNEKFFDIKKEKQDRIISAAQKAFALYGYMHASTDLMVRDAGISKGLLFHYFETKLGLYTFVYDYSVRFIGINFTTNVSREEKDYFVLAEQVERAWADAMQQFPYIRLFLSGAEADDTPEAASAILESRQKYEALLAAVKDRASGARFVQDAVPSMIEKMISFTGEGLLRQALHDGTFSPDSYREDITGYIRMMKALTYR